MSKCHACQKDQRRNRDTKIGTKSNVRHFGPTVALTGQFIDAFGLYEYPMATKGVAVDTK